MSCTFAEQLRNDLFKAYEDARKNKRNTNAQLDFEKDAEHNLIQLYEELRDQTYTPGKALCFLSTYPVLREVFASQFRDRVVHHLLFNYIAPIFERGFIYDSYSCRKGKGTKFGIERLDHHIRSCSNNYTKNVYVLKLDIQGYFMSINKKILYDIISRKLFKHWEKNRVDCSTPSRNPEFIDFLLRQIIFKDHTLDCVVRGNKEDWMLLPASKTLFNQPTGIGLPIGDLTSQLFSNIYLGEFDNFIKRELHIKHYGRYVDDFFVVHQSKAYLRSIIPTIKQYLAHNLQLTLHPKKIYLQPYTHGVPFLGAFVKPHRMYTCPRSVKAFNEKAQEIKKKCEKEELSQAELEQIRATLNSYCGYFGHQKSYKLIHKTLTMSSIFKHVYFTSGYGKAIPRSRYKKRRIQKYKTEQDIKRILTT